MDRAVGLLAALHIATSTFGLEFADCPENATLVWPTTGLAFGALILFGRRLWPGVFTGAPWHNAHDTTLDWIPSAEVAIGNTLEAVVGALLLEREPYRSDRARRDCTETDPLESIAE